MNYVSVTRYTTCAACTVLALVTQLIYVVCALDLQVYQCTSPFPDLAQPKPLLRPVYVCSLEDTELR